MSAPLRMRRTCSVTAHPSRAPLTLFHRLPVSLITPAAPETQQSHPACAAMVIAFASPPKGQEGTLVTIQGLFAPGAGGGTKTVKVEFGGKEAHTCPWRRLAPPAPPRGSACLPMHRAGKWPWFLLR